MVSYIPYEKTEKPLITNTGKELIAKFLLGQAPAYATHISLGCGTRPGLDLPRTVTARELTDGRATLTSLRHGYRINDVIIVSISASTYNGTYKIIEVTENTFTYNLDRPNSSNVATTGTVRLSLAAKSSMDFEMIRVPISSRGYVNEDGSTQIAFAAEMPTSSRFLVTEAALWSAGSNANAVNVDSRMLSTFGLIEGWKYHHGQSIEEVPYRAYLATTPPDIDASLVGKVFMAPSDTPVMTNANRANRYEPGRYLSSTIMMRGDSSKVVSSDQASRNGFLSIDGAYANEHIHLDTSSMDLSQNNPNDELRLAFSVVSRVAANPVTPQKTRVYVEFLHSESDSSSGFARMYGEVWDEDIQYNRYFVLSKKLSDLTVSNDFSWSKVRVVRVFVSCYDALGELDGQHYVSLDALRFENLNTLNPVYGMTGYAVFNDGNSTAPKPIYKSENTSNYIEFRARMGVV